MESKSVKEKKKDSKKGLKRQKVNWSFRDGTIGVCHMDGSADIEDRHAGKFFYFFLIEVDM